MQAQGLPAPHKPFFKSLYFQVLVATFAGVLLGHFSRSWANK